MLAPRRSFLKIAAWDQDGLQVSADTIDAVGNTLHPEISYKFDGKDYPLTGSPIADRISARRINEREAQGVWKKSGKVVLAVRTI
jgi:hypothetical protein